MTIFSRWFLNLLLAVNAVDSTSLLSLHSKLAITLFGVYSGLAWVKS